MTHYVRGHIITPRDSSNYNPITINDLVAGWFRRRGTHIMSYDKKYGTATYSPTPRTQPFVEVREKPRALKKGLEGISFDEHMSVLVTIESGSHVSILDEEAKEIYLASKSLHSLLAKNISGGRNIKLIFDDDNKRYSANKLKRIIKRNEDNIPEDDEDPC